MIVQASTAGCKAKLSACIIRADGSRYDAGVISTDDFSPELSRLKRLWKTLSSMVGPAAAILLIAGMAKSGRIHPLSIPMLGLVTDAGLNYLAVAFTVDAAGTDIFNMKFHDSGIGTTAAVQTDTILQTQSGPATRATGVNTQSQSASGTGSTTPAIVLSVGTINYLSTLAITEWGLFSQAAQGGTMWDHRIFAALNVVTGDSIQFSYSLSIPGGGT